MSPTPKIGVATINDLTHFDDLEPLSEKDIECFDEIRRILKKYDTLDRFGITLLHKHFDLNDNEMLVEELDANTRTMHISPRKPEEENLEFFQTAWRLGEGTEIILGCIQTCVWRQESDGKQRHSIRHVTKG